MPESALHQWHDAVNTANLEQARRVVSDPVVVNGPHGSGAISATDFADWITRSGIRLQPVSWHPVAERIVVVEQDATWPEAPEPARVATVFRLTGDHVSAALRFPDRAQALAFASLYAALLETP
ncbi:MAG: hypothetical protein QM692_04300 [Thermomicrobiales bacterium]